MKKCLGCGITLQNKSKDILGYTENIENNLCERCFKLKNYGLYTKVPLTNKNYTQILKAIPTSSTIVYVTDILSLDTTWIEKLNHPILVITKKDILPKSTKNEKIISYIHNHYPNISNIILTSSKTGEGIPELYKKISNYQKIYIVGTTNSGKSTLINKLINYYGETKENTITASMYPSTTLDTIEIKIDNTTIIDTPGLINEGNITNYIDEAGIKKITPKKEIKPKSCQIEGKGSIAVDNYVRIDYTTKSKTSIVIYTSNNLNIHFINKNNSNLKNLSKYEYSLTSKKDVVIPGLGFIKCKDPIDITLYITKGTVPIIRDNLI